LLIPQPVQAPIQVQNRTVLGQPLAGSVPPSPLPGGGATASVSQPLGQATVWCPGCGREIALPSEELGMEIECARCHSAFVPGQGAASPQQPPQQAADYGTQVTGDTGAADPPIPLTKPEPSSDARQWAMFCHLSAVVAYLVGLIIIGPVIAFVGPLICWLVKRDSSPFVDHHGKEALNFQLNILLYGVVLLTGSLVLFFVTCGLSLFVTIALLGGLGVYPLVMPIIAGLKANEGAYYRYPLTFRILK
jgi:uncharacterized Tic20 family protein